MKTKLNILSVIMLVASLIGVISVSAQDRPAPPGYRPTDRTERPAMKELSGVLKIPKDFGVVPANRGYPQPSTSPCGQFYVAVLDPAKGNQAVATTSSSGQGADQGEFYTCKYALMVPVGKSFYMTAGMGGTLLLPKEDRHPLFITDPWIGGARNTPPRGYERGFRGKYLTMGAVKNTYLAFEMIYLRVEPE